MHWLALKKIANEVLHFVTVLNLEDFVFRKFAQPKLPPNNNNNNEHWFLKSLLAYGDSLAAFQVAFITDLINIWVIKEYGVASSWTKIFTISQMVFPRGAGFTGNGELILEVPRGQLVSQHLGTQMIKYLRIIGYHDSYVKSLVLISVYFC